MKNENVKVDTSKGTVTMKINPRLYPQSAVMRAAYRFIDSFDVVVSGDPLKEVNVEISLKEGETAAASELEQVVKSFNAELIHASVEEVQARRYADTRNALIGAAVRSMLAGAKPEQLKDKGKTEKVKGG